MPGRSCGSRFCQILVARGSLTCARDRMCPRQFARPLMVEIKQNASDMVCVRKERDSAMAKRDVLSSVFRGACARCPSCGRGQLFRAYLKPVESCAECNVSLKHIRADD